MMWLTKITCLCDIVVNFKSVNSSSCHSKYTSTALSIFAEAFEDHIESNFTASFLLIIINLPQKNSTNIYELVSQI